MRARQISAPRAASRRCRQAQAASSRAAPSSLNPAPRSNVSPRTHSRKAGGGLAPEGLFENRQHAFRRQRVTEMGQAVARKNLGEGERRRRVPAGVEKEREIGALQIERMFDLKLVILDQYAVRPLRIGDARQQQRPEARRRRAKHCPSRR